jgi:hypothetical protein
LAAAAAGPGTTLGQSKWWETKKIIKGNQLCCCIYKI